MSIAELKDRFRDIPGIENLTMRLEGGQQVFSLGGAFVSTPPLAMDAEIGAALRTIAPVPGSTIPVAAPFAPSVSAAPAPVATAPAAPLAPPTPAAAHLTMKAMMENHMRGMAQLQETQAALVQLSMDRQMRAVSEALGSVAQTIDGQTDDFLAMMGQITNGAGI